MRTTLLLLTSLVSLLVLVLRLAGFTVKVTLRLAAVLLRTLNRAATTTSVRVSPGRSF